MYMRSYGAEEERMPLPSGYDGTAFEKEINEKAAEDVAEALAPEEKTEEAGLSLKLPFFKGFGTFKGIKLPFDLGGEDLVLLGLALLLFFTKDGDRECALMIALLLFIR